MAHASASARFQKHRTVNRTSLLVGGFLCLLGALHRGEPLGEFVAYPRTDPSWVLVCQSATLIRNDGTRVHLGTVVARDGNTLFIRKELFPGTTSVTSLNRTTAREWARRGNQVEYGIPDRECLDRLPKPTKRAPMA